MLPNFGLRAPNINVAGLVVPGRNAVSPPQLSADAPVLQIPHPGKVGVLPLLGHEFDVAIFHRLDGGLGQLGHSDVPLIGQIGFQHGARSVAPGHRQAVVFDLDQQPGGFKVGNDGLARLKAIHALVLFRGVNIDAGVVV